METTALVAWLFLLAGVPVSIFWGRRSGAGKPPGGWGAALGITIVIVLSLCFLINFGLAGCVALKVCRPGGDAGIVYVFYPFVAAPVYWITAGIAAGKSKR